MGVSEWVLAGGLGGLALLVILIYNSLVRRRNQVKNAWSQIDVQLKRRHDLIPNLVAAVKDYMAYEQETLTKVIAARNAAVSASGPQDAIPAEALLSGLLGNLFALMENYPDLKASQNVAQLMEELSTTENKIAFARQFYNDSVMTLNNAVHMFPSNVVAALFRFAEGVLFATAEEEKAVPKVKLR